jgi:glycosyltransferase 2 family protein
MRVEQADSTGRSWSIALLTETEPGRRNRRTIDSVFLALASIVIGLSAAIASSAPTEDEDVAQALSTILGWADPFWRGVFVGVLVLAGVIVIDVPLRRRWDLVRDLLVAGLLVFGAAILLGRVVISDWFPLEAHILSNWGYPELRLATATGAIVVVGPELVRSVRVLATWLVPLAALGAVVISTAFPSAILGALALGIGAAALVRLVFGTAEGFPPSEDVRRALATLGVEVAELRPASLQHRGAVEYLGTEARGAQLKVRVFSRDAQDTQRLARRWRSLAYRDPPRSVADGRLEQVEHEALVTLMAAQAGVRVPEVVMAALGPDGDAFMVTRQPNIDPLESLSPNDVSDETLESLWEQAARLHAAGISHGRLNASNVLVLAEGPMLVDLSAATLGAPQSALDIDVAELMVASTVLVGPERALRKAVDAGWGDAVGRVLPYLQRAALTPHLRDLARTHEIDLKNLRSAAAEATGQEVPELAPLRRVRPKDLLMTAALVFAAYLLISQLADVGFRTIIDQLREAEPAWLVVALLLAQSTFIANGISVRGGLAEPLPLLPCVVLQSAMKFINLTVPSSAGRIGMNLRFLQRMGVSTPHAVAAGAADDASETIVQIGLLLLAIPFVRVDVDTGQFGGGGPDTRLLVAVGVVLLVSAVLIFTVPKLREKVLPPVRSAFSSLWTVIRDRRKRLELFGGSIAAELLYSLALGATCLAYGIHLNLAQLVFINSSAAVLSGLVPVPGGIGAAEASLAAGLIAMGVDEPSAFAIAITQRLWTFYLPPIWGYASLQWLTRKGYV